MTYWPFWISGLALSLVMLFHWFSLHRMMAVSGRISALVDRMRHGSGESQSDFSQAELLAAIQEATAVEFAAADTMTQSAAPLDSVEKTNHSAPSAAPLTPPLLTPPLLTRITSSSEHILFFAGLILGGFLAVGLTHWHGEFALRSSLFSNLTGGNIELSTGLLLLGGVFVGFGTRMAGGCTSGHGLCGTSRLQSGSLLATASFFGAGIGTSFALGMFL